MPVIVVPMFEPNVSGNTRSMVTNPIPTSGTNVEVNTDELCIITVNAVPILLKKQMFPNEYRYFFN